MGSGNTSGSGWLFEHTLAGYAQYAGSIFSICCKHIAPFALPVCKQAVRNGRFPRRNPEKAWPFPYFEWRSHISTRATCRLLGAETGSSQTIGSASSYRGKHRVHKDIEWKASGPSVCFVVRQVEACIRIHCSRLGALIPCDIITHLGGTTGNAIVVRLTISGCTHQSPLRCHNIQAPIEN